MKKTRNGWSKAIAITVALSLVGNSMAQAVRELGVDISYWNCGTSSTGISQANWNTGYSTGNRHFAFIRATRGGTTGLDQGSGTPGGGSTSTLSERYDDSRFNQNFSRAVAAGMLTGPYHFARPDVVGNTGDDEADHFMQMAGPWMRPGFMMPMFDQEANSASGTDALVQFSLDFSDRIYAVMQIRPCIYINGNYSSIFQGATLSLRDQLAKPPTATPSAIGPAYPMLWDARYADNTNPDAIPVQTGSPKYTYTVSSGYYGPWDDYGDTDPWSFWQYASTTSVAGFNNVDSGIDSNVSHGDIEYVRNYLVPVVWWNNSSGDWSTTNNWNCGQTPITPVTGAGQATPYASPVMPPVRLPGTAGVNGSVATSGQYQYDTVILERPNTNITVTVSSGTHNIRKLYMRETLNITGGSLTMSYNPDYRADDSADVLHGGPLSAQFSGPVTLSGGTLNVHTLQVDTNRVFTLGGGTLALNTINLMPHSTTPAKILVTNTVNINASGGTVATITNGTGSGKAGFIDLGAGTRSISVGSTSDLLIQVALTNGGLTKAGLGIMRLGKPSTYTLGTTVSGGTLLVNNTSGSGTGTAGVTVNSGATLGGTGIISGLVSVSAGATIAPGVLQSIGTLTLGSAQTLSGTAFMAVDRNGGSPLADKIVVSSGTLNYGGALTVSNAGAAFVGGEVFTLFTAPSYAGAFAATNLPALTNGMNWWLGSLVTNGSIKVNRKPIGNTDTFTNSPTQVLQIPIASLKSNDTDPDNDAITLVSIGATTTNGVTLTTNSTYIFYTNNINVADQFSYTISDGRGGSTTGLVSIVKSTNAIFSTIPTVSSNSTTLQIIGNPGTTYFLDRSTNLPTWVTISTNVAPANGVINFTDTFPGLNKPVPAAYYRFKW